MNVAFSGLALRAEPGSVMVPRRTSEALVDAAVALAGDGAVRIADVGTGSGAIALALAARLPNAEVLASDTSPAAVALARANACRLGLGQRVGVYRGDLLDPLPGAFDLIVANLPYVPFAEADDHPDLVGEPPAAVFAPGDGLGPYRRLLAACGGRLNRAGHLVIQLHKRVLVTTA